MAAAGLGAWMAIARISSERLTALRRVATIESTGSSTRIEGAKLSDKEVEALLTGLEVKVFAASGRPCSRSHSAP